MNAFTCVYQYILLKKTHQLFISDYSTLWGFPGGSAVKNPPAMQETQVRSLGQEDPLEQGMATHSSILAWRIPWTEEPGGLQSMGSQKSRDTSETIQPARTQV